jgi:hypothetical protein
MATLAGVMRELYHDLFLFTVIASIVRCAINFRFVGHGPGIAHRAKGCGDASRGTHRGPVYGLNDVRHIRQFAEAEPQCPA